MRGTVPELACGAHVFFPESGIPVVGMLELELELFSLYWIGLLAAGSCILGECPDREGKVVIIVSVVFRNICGVPL
jgi:hypothetical protein